MAVVVIVTETAVLDPNMHVKRGVGTSTIVSNGRRGVLTRRDDSDVVKRTSQANNMPQRSYLNIGDDSDGTKCGSSSSSSMRPWPAQDNGGSGTTSTWHQFMDSNCETHMGEIYWCCPLQLASHASAPSNCHVARFLLRLAYHRILWQTVWGSRSKPIENAVQ